MFIFHTYFLRSACSVAARQQASGRRMDLLWHLILRRTHQATMVLSMYEAAAETLPSSPVLLKLLSTPVEAAASAPNRSQHHFLCLSHTEAEPHDRGD